MHIQVIRNVFFKKFAVHNICVIGFRNLFRLILQVVPFYNNIMLGPAQEYFFVLYLVKVYSFKINTKLIEVVGVQVETASKVLVYKKSFFSSEVTSFQEENRVEF